MKLLKAITIATSLFALTSIAHADEQPKDGGLFLEPAITYQSGDMTVTYPSPISATSTENTKGYGLGLKAGMHVYDSLFLAVDGRYARPDYKSSALNGTATAEATNLGVTLGAQTPLAGIRVWGTYILTGSLNPQDIGSFDVKFNDFKGYRVGAGLYVASVSLNLEYQEGKYDSVTVEKAGPFATNSNFDSIKGTDKSYILSVSFPIAM